MDFFQIIDKKKNGYELNYDEYFYFVDNYIKNNLPDYQASALLMAIYINGMSDQELFDLVDVMIKTSEIITPHATNTLKLVVDKHSSGGIGDKVSLILSPILAALGYDVVKLSGRGLSFTGGTIDKLESIGISYTYDPLNFQNYLDKTHFVLMLQSDNILPSDKKMYSLRDVTGTVDSLPLIAASIMSKKLIIKSDYIFLDVKVGEGAFFKTIAQAEQFSKLVLKITKKFKRKTIIHLTNMSQPLGHAIGNAIEVREAINFLQNKITSQNLKDLIYGFTADILVDTNVCLNKQDAIKKIDDVLTSGKAYEKFINYVQVFSTPKFYEDKIPNNTYFIPQYKLDIYAPTSGYITFQQVNNLGLLLIYLGGGRFKKEDALDFQAGVQLYFDPNDYINQGQLIATLYADKPIDSKLVSNFLDNLKFTKTKSDIIPIIIKKIQ